MNERQVEMETFTLKETLLRFLPDAKPGEVSFLAESLQDRWNAYCKDTLLIEGDQMKPEIGISLVKTWVPEAIAELNQRFIATLQRKNKNE